MQTRNHEVGIDLAVSFDEGAKIIIVSRYKRPFPHFVGEWEVVDTITNEVDWYKSEYQMLIIGDGNVAMIAYFWHDNSQST